MKSYNIYLSIIIAIILTKNSMFGLTGSQSIASVLLLVFIIMYFAATNGLKQNAFIFLFATTAIVLIVGNFVILM
jgi:hypothetical protein